MQRGRITELTGPLAVGKTALLRQVVTQVLTTGAWVAWIDAGRTLAPAPWARGHWPDALPIPRAGAARAAGPAPVWRRSPGRRAPAPGQERARPRHERARMREP
ncbi:MAG: hypothetical protein EBV77_12400 [Gemmatimonadaceae bacterium]|nr:hypothetical protein [Gemmatimonadaceae bacterium]